MPRKLEVEDALTFIFMALDSVQMKIDYHQLGKAYNDINASAARMKLKRLRESVVKGEFRDAVLIRSDSGHKISQALIQRARESQEAKVKAGIQRKDDFYQDDDDFSVVDDSDNAIDSVEYSTQLTGYARPKSTQSRQGSVMAPPIKLLATRERLPILDRRSPTIKMEYDGEPMSMKHSRSDSDFSHDTISDKKPRYGTATPSTDGLFSPNHLYPVFQGLGATRTASVQPSMLEPGHSQSPVMTGQAQLHAQCYGQGIPQAYNKTAYHQPQHVQPVSSSYSNEAMSGYPWYNYNIHPGLRPAYPSQYVGASSGPYSSPLATSAFTMSNPAFVTEPAMPSTPKLDATHVSTYTSPGVPASIVPITPDYGHTVLPAHVTQGRPASSPLSQVMTFAARETSESRTASRSNSRNPARSHSVPATAVDGSKNEGNGIVGASGSIKAVANSSKDAYEGDVDSADEDGKNKSHDAIEVEDENALFITDDEHPGEKE